MAPVVVGGVRGWLHFSLVYALKLSDGANKVLKNKFTGNSKIVVLQEIVGVNSIPVTSLDLAMSLGVLHHIPDTALAIKDVRGALNLVASFFATCITTLKISRPTTN